MSRILAFQVGGFALLAKLWFARALQLKRRSETLQRLLFRDMELAVLFSSDTYRTGPVSWEGKCRQQGYEQKYRVLLLSIIIMAVQRLHLRVCGQGLVDRLQRSCFGILKLFFDGDSGSVCLYKSKRSVRLIAESTDVGGG